MSARPNRKVKSKRRKKKSPWLARFKTFAISMLLGAVAGVGFWRCFDDGGADAFEPLSKEEVRSSMVLENGQDVDPTLVNEKNLLKQEASEKQNGTAPQHLKGPPGEPDEDENETASEPEQAPEESPEEVQERFPLYAVAYHFHTQVRAEPEADAKVIGYARRGSTFRVSERVSKKGCPRGWHEIAPGGLFACSGDGVLVSSEPVTFSPSPPAPRLGASLPYDYAYVNADNTPQYWRIPTFDEEREVAALFERIESDEKLQPPKEVATNAESVKKFADAGPDEEVSSAEAKEGSEQVLEEGEKSNEHELPEFVHLRMSKGYFVSVDGEEEGPEEKFTRTIRGRYIQANKLFAAKPSSFEGLLLDEGSLPRAFVVGGGVKMLIQKSPGGPLESGSVISRLSDLPFLGELKRRARAYFQVGENEFVNSRVAAVVRKVEPPEDLEPGERWIDVDLSEQTLVAYEGSTPVFATLVSTGRDGFETPQGTFRIYSKHVSITMDDTNAGEEAYSIEDVPWTQYFDEGFALHAAFWHNRYGRVRSHGCVNLSPGDARRLFFWTGPHLPEGLHGIMATKNDPGTRIVIHE